MNYQVADLMDINRIPEWAQGATASQSTHLDYEAHDLTVAGKHVGCVYDDGNGYVFARGVACGELFRLDGK